MYGHTRARRTGAYVAIITLAFLTYVVISRTLSGTLPFLHTVDLIFHEAGHTLTLPFGKFIHFLGGTIGQLAVPVFLLFAFLRKGDFIGLYVSLWWVGQNLLDISLYVGDARLQQIPLLGGEHDWLYLLGEMRLLQYDTAIAKTILFLGIVIMIVSVLLLYMRTRGNYNNHYSL